MIDCVGIKVDSLPTRSERLVIVREANVKSEDECLQSNYITQGGEISRRLFLYTHQQIFTIPAFHYNSITFFVIIYIYPTSRLSNPPNFGALKKTQNF